MQPDALLLRFVRGLLGGAAGERLGEHYQLADGRRASSAAITLLLQSGALSGDAGQCRANDTTASWLKRAQLDRDAIAAQHRVIVDTPAGAQLNLNESPLQRLAVGPDPFLEPHQVEAGERVRRILARAQLTPRTTMNYSPTVKSASNNNSAGDLSDMALDARRALADIHRVLPRDCAGVIVDVCGLLKGLQAVERDRGWPRRSAKLVLRIGLEQLAHHYGLSPHAIGQESRKRRVWLEEGARPERFG